MQARCALMANLKTKIKRSSVAFILSLLAPGLGHVYDGKTLIGISLWGFGVLLTFAASVFGFLHGFRTALAYLVVGLAFRLAVPVHAAFVAVRQVKTNNMPVHTKQSYLAAALILFTTLAVNFTVSDLLGFRAYKVESQSMAPTVVVGDRIVADLRYYKSHPPSRGDVIVFRTPTNEIYVKRVIAVSGDTVEVDAKGATVNGQLLSEPYVIFDKKMESDTDFGPVDVASNKVFVMGDNRDHSFDSRHFGAIDVNRVIGKVLYIYYSSRDKERIGQPIR